MIKINLLRPQWRKTKIGFIVLAETKMSFMVSEKGQLYRGFRVLDLVKEDKLDAKTKGHKPQRQVD